MSEEETVLVCVRVADGGMVALDSVQRACHRCGEAVWVAPSGVRMIARMDALVRCMACTVEMDDGEDVVMPITDEQIAEAILARLHHGRRN